MEKPLHNATLLTDDQTSECSWIALEAATRNLVVLLRLAAPAPEGLMQVPPLALGEDKPTSGGDIAAATSPEGTGGNEAAALTPERLPGGDENNSKKCSAQSSASKQTNAAGDVHLMQAGLIEPSATATADRSRHPSYPRRRT